MAQWNFRVPVVGHRKALWPDVAIVHLKIDIEYDGAKHYTKEGKAHDKLRDAELALMGWRVIHVNKWNWKMFLEHIQFYVEGRGKLPVRPGA